MHDLKTACKRYAAKILAAELSTLSDFAAVITQVAPLKEDDGYLLSMVACAEKRVVSNASLLPAPDKSRVEHILFNGNLNFDFDIQDTLQRLLPRLQRSSRLLVVAYNPYLRWLYLLLNFLRVREAPIPSTFLTLSDLHNLCKISDFEIVRFRRAVYAPLSFFGLGDFFNKILPLIPVIKWLSLASIIVLRPRLTEAAAPSLSIIVPARNERGNIERMLTMFEPRAGVDVEFVFVEGHSNDGTWEEILRVKEKYAQQFKIAAYRQLGVGKGDAVRLGFAHAHHELLLIVDADLSVPVPLIWRFYDAYVEGAGDFVNGNRLTYEMERHAMRYLNRVGNVFFAKALSYILETRLGDSLCGSKLLSALDYSRCSRWRMQFGEFDPFGDFELLFPAAQLGLGIVDIPVRYRDRVYGMTNIRRFYHGLMLFKMAWTGWLRIKLGKTKWRAANAHEGLQAH